MIIWTTVISLELNGFWFYSTHTRRKFNLLNWFYGRNDFCFLRAYKGPHNDSRRPLDIIYWPLFWFKRPQGVISWKAVGRCTSNYSFVNAQMWSWYLYIAVADRRKAFVIYLINRPIASGLMFFSFFFFGWWRGDLNRRIVVICWANNYREVK